MKGEKTGGRGPGSLNKTTSIIKEGFIAAYKDLQNDPKNNLTAWAKEQPTEFYKIVSKFIPTEITGSVTTYVINEVAASDCLPIEAEMNGNGQH